MRPGGRPREAAGLGSVRLMAAAAAGRLRAQCGGNHTERARAWSNPEERARLLRSRALETTLLRRMASSLLAPVARESGWDCLFCEGLAWACARLPVEHCSFRLSAAQREGAGRPRAVDTWTCVAGVASGSAGFVCFDVVRDSLAVQTSTEQTTNINPLSGTGGHHEGTAEQVECKNGRLRDCGICRKSKQ